MREYTGKANGKVFKGIYTNSCMPNQKQKRTRAKKENSMDRVKINISLFGIFFAIVTAMQTQLEISWKVGLITLFLLASIHAKVESDE